MKKLLLILIVSVTWHASHAQGCVAIRSNGGTCTMSGPHQDKDHGPAADWTFSLNSRYFKSFRHFVGTEEQKQRVANGSEVINHSFSTELGLTKSLNNRWSLAVYAPIISNTRSSKYEHYGNESNSPNARQQTRSFGLGDVRLAAYYWLLDPARSKKLNIQTGLGIKLPTGDYRYQDYFKKNDSVKVLGPVDQSIQLGDGGTGITGELNAFYHLTKNITAYFNGYYLLNPREQNGVSTSRGNATQATAIAYGTDVMSVPDQYMVRAGGSVLVNKFTFSAGMRLECVPVYDLVGGSSGFRRPGYVLSAEPVAAYNTGKVQFYVSVPWAVERNRTQSVPDKVRTQKTGVYSQGDAAFADYSINAGISVSFR